MFYSFCFPGYVNIWNDLQICAVFLVIPDGTISSSSILLAQSLQHCIHSQTCAATDLFYQGNSQAIREWLTVAITRTLHQGEESLLDLTKQICSFLQVKYSLFQKCWVPFSGALVLCDCHCHRELFLWMDSVILIVVGTLKAEAAAMLWIELK